MRKYFLIFLLFIFALPIIAENVTNVRVRQEGKSIIVTYDLSQKSVVRLLMASGESDVYTELKAVSGNVGKGVPAGENRKIVWKPLEENEKFIAQNVRFKVEAQSAYDYYAQNAKIKTLVMGQVGYSVAPQLSYGVMIGQMYKGIGWFANARSNFQTKHSTDLHTSHGSDGGISAGELEETPFFSGKSNKSHFDVNAGFMMNFLEWSTKNKFNTFGCYLGIGYGDRTLQWETTDGIWVDVSYHTYRGVSANLGFFGSVLGATISAGISTINFEYMEVEMGIGFMF